MISYKKIIILIIFSSLLISQSNIKKEIVVAGKVISNNLSNDILDSSISKALQEIKIQSWDYNILLREHDLEKILREQSLAEELEGAVQRPIILGQILNVDYFITADIKENTNGTEITLKFLSIESGEIINSLNEFHEFYDEDRTYPRVKSERFQIRMNLMIKKLFNSVFYEQKPLELGKQCNGITKKNKRCKNREPYSIINDIGYCIWHD